MKVSELIAQVQGEFADTFTLTDAYLCDVYNTEAAALSLRLPANAVCTAADADFILTLPLAAAQIDRVFLDGRELLRVSRAVREALGEKSLYAAEDGKIYVNTHGSFKISYRLLPAAVAAADAAVEDIPFPAAGIAYLRTAMIRAVYLSLGDLEAAKAAFEEGERLFSALAAGCGGARR